MTAAGEPYRQLRGQTLLHLLLTYLAPVLVLAVCFTWQFHELARESRQRHLLSIAENQANTLDLFSRERLVNLTNLRRRFEQDQQRLEELARTALGNSPLGILRRMKELDDDRK